MPQDRHRLFVEETVLSTREAVDDALLEQRLFARLTALGLVVRHVHGRERCTIPMDLPLPDTAGAVLATGAAGALVHPSSGYMLPRALGAAASVVEALTDAWDQGPAVALAAARRALWPQRARQLHALQTFGLEVLLDLDQAGSQAFFGALGGLDAADWQVLMGSDPDRQRVTAAMGRLFLTAPGSVRGALLRPCLRPAGRRQLLRALTPGRS
jgi:lycopene beta-cyclase